jgi:hypothetical protein
MVHFPVLFTIVTLHLNFSDTQDNFSPVSDHALHTRRFRSRMKKYIIAGLDL